MIITIELTEEQPRAVDAVAAKLGETPEAYFTRHCMREVDNLTASAYDSSAQRPGDAARNLPYATRVALIEQVESAVS